MNNNRQQLEQNMQTSSGLMRYQSAPSIYFASLLNNPVSDSGFGEDEFVDLLYPEDSIPETQKVFTGFMNNSPANPPFPPPRTTDSNYSSVSRNMYSEDAKTALQDSYCSQISSIPPAQIKPETGGISGRPGPDANSSLIRQSSSPAGLFSGKNGTDYSRNSWKDQVISADDFLKESTENDQRNKSLNRPSSLLSRHLSLPKSSAEFTAMEKTMQDSVPCKIRAKRGFATHPRSIAERVRRTKISERIRKLQELVPNMEKQTNTSDMLDLAVDYIKDLQKRVKILSEDRAKCNCSAQRI